MLPPAHSLCCSDISILYVCFTSHSPYYPRALEPAPLGAWVTFDRHPTQPFPQLTAHLSNLSSVSHPQGSISLLRYLWVLCPLPLEHLTWFHILHLPVFLINISIIVQMLSSRWSISHFFPPPFLWLFNWFIFSLYRSLWLVSLVSSSQFFLLSILLPGWFS